MAYRPETSGGRSNPETGSPADWWFGPQSAWGQLSSAWNNATAPVRGVGDNIYGALTGQNPLNQPPDPNVINNDIAAWTKAGLSPEQIAGITNRHLTANNYDAAGAMDEANALVFQNQSAVNQGHAQELWNRDQQDRTALLGSLDTLKNQWTERQGHYQQLAQDPNALRTDAEYAGVLKDVANTTSQQEALARQEAGARAAASGGGIGGAALNAAMQARFAGQLQRQNAEQAARSNAVGQQNFYGNQLGNVPQLESGIRFGSADQARSSLGGLSGQLGQGFSFTPDYSGLRANQIGQQTYGIGRQDQAIGNGLSFLQTGLGSLQQGMGTLANSAPQFIKGLH